MDPFLRFIPNQAMVKPLWKTDLTQDLAGN